MDNSTSYTTDSEGQGFTNITQLVTSFFMTTPTLTLSNTTDDDSDMFLTTADMELDNNGSDDGGESYANQDDYYPDYAGDYPDDYDIFVYPGFEFERPIYMFVWEILVILTCLVNILVITILLRKSMRTPTNMILTAIAISDSLTGLVTLPSYIMVYQKFDPCKSHHGHLNESMYGPETTTVSHDLVTGNVTGMDGHHGGQHGCVDSYILTKDTCRFFMISKFFVSKTFHTMSIWLTLFLAIQRYISVAFPFKSQALFTIEKTVISCSVVVVLSPILHIYHLLHEKAVPDTGMCQWELEENCEGSCAHLWVTFLLRHFIPCLLLVVFTILFIRELMSSSNKAMNMQSSANKTSFKKRQDENRRISLVVTTIVVVFLIPEIPYGAFLLSSVIKHMSHIPTDLEQNRAIHAAYEILLVLTFHANFYIYTFLNKRFRIGLKKTVRCVIKPFSSALDLRRASNVSRSTSFNTASYGRTATSEFLSKSAIPLEDMSRSASLKHSNGTPPNSVQEEEKTKFIGSEKDVKL